MSEQIPQRRPFYVHLVMLTIGVIAVLYVLNPLSIADLIPDALPIVGNLDDGGAVIVLLGVLRFYGMDLTAFFGRPNKERIGKDS